MAIDRDVLKRHRCVRGHPVGVGLDHDRRAGTHVLDGVVVRVDRGHGAGEAYQRVVRQAGDLGQRIGVIAVVLRDYGVGCSRIARLIILRPTCPELILVGVSPVGLRGGRNECRAVLPRAVGSAAGYAVEVILHAADGSDVSIAVIEILLSIVQ